MILWSWAGTLLLPIILGHQVLREWLHGSPPKIQKIKPNSKAADYQLCLMQIDRLEKLNRKLEQEYEEIINPTLSGLERACQRYDRVDSIVGPQTLESLMRDFERQISNSFSAMILGDGMKIESRRVSNENPLRKQDRRN